MSNEIIYIPSLKWKRAEQKALEQFPVADRNRVAPLIEVVLPMVPRHKDKERKVKKTDEEMLTEMVKKYKEERIPTIPSEIERYWGTHAIYVDFSLVHNGLETPKLKTQSIKSIVPAAQSLGLHVIPVVNLKDPTEIKVAIREVSKKNKKGVCVRVLKSDLSDIGLLNTGLGSFLTQMDVTRADVDLLVDLKNEKDGAKYAELFDKAQRIASINEWRSFIFASGAFPVNLLECKLDEPITLPRHDWFNWLTQVSRPGLTREPIYADYTIRTPLFDESLQFHEATTSIKYTKDDGWYVLKGKVRGFELFLANAKLLVEDSGFFYGENFSAGDRYIAAKAQHYDVYIKNPLVKGTGTNETWIGAGISHHLALVVHRVSSLGRKSLHVHAPQGTFDQK